MAATRTQITSYLGLGVGEEAAAKGQGGDENGLCHDCGHGSTTAHTSHYSSNCVLKIGAFSCVQITPQ